MAGGWQRVYREKRQRDKGASVFAKATPRQVGRIRRVKSPGLQVTFFVGPVTSPGALCDLRGSARNLLLNAGDDGAVAKGDGETQPRTLLWIWSRKKRARRSRSTFVAEVLDLGSAIMDRSYNPLCLCTTIRQFLVFLHVFFHNSLLIKS